MTAEFLTGLIAANLAACAAVGLALLLRRPLRRLAGARAAYALWLIVPVAMIASLAPPRVGGEAVLAAAPIRPAAEAAVEFISVMAPAAQGGFDATPLVYLWLAGAAGFAALVSFGHHRAMASFGLLGRDPAGFTRAASREAGPALIGLFRPSIVLPTDFETRFDAREQAMILAHERTHLKDGHLWINALTALIRAACWFNPLVHLGAFHARVDQELACDAAVAERFPGERRTYAEAMLKTQLAAAPLPLGCYWPGGSSTLLRERLEMLARTQPTLARRLAGAAAMAALLTGAGYTAWAAAPEPVLAFEAEPQAAAPAQDVTLTNAGGKAAEVRTTPRARTAATGRQPAANSPAPTSLSQALADLQSRTALQDDPENAGHIRDVLDLSDGGSFVDQGVGADGARTLDRVDAQGIPKSRIFLHPNGRDVGMAVVVKRGAEGARRGEQVAPGVYRLLPPPATQAID